MKGRKTLTACTVGLLLLVTMGLPRAAQPAKQAQSQAAEPGPDKALMEKILDAWSGVIPNMNFDKVAPYYAQDPRNVFYDITPLKYVGWKQYTEGVSKAFADYSSGKFTVNPDAQVHRRGNMAWGTTTSHAELVKKDGTKETLEARWTAVWEKRGDNWVIVHDHFSAPLPAPPVKATRK